MAATERIFVAQPAIAAGGRVVVSPFQFFSDGSENLRLRVWSSLVTHVGLQGRWLRAVGEVHPFRYDVLTTSDRLPLEQNFPLDAGYMLNCSIGILGSTITQIGQTFVQLALVRGRGGAAVEMGTILQGYVATSHWIAFPGSPVQHAFEGPGYKHPEVMAAPAAGADIIITVPDHARWRVYSVFSSFVASAAAANRFPALAVRQGVATPIWSIQAPLVVTAGTGFNFYWTPGIPFGPAATAIANQFQVPLPDPVWMPSLYTMRTETANIQAGDQWGLMRVFVEEWLETDVFGAPL